MISAVSSFKSVQDAVNAVVEILQNSIPVARIGMNFFIFSENQLLDLLFFFFLFFTFEIIVVQLWKSNII